MAINDTEKIMLFSFQDQTHCFLPKEYSRKVALMDGRLDQSVILNENYSHYILIDDGTENNFGGEIYFRTSLEKFISGQRVDPVNPDNMESCEWFYAHVGPLIYCLFICCTLEYSCVIIYIKLIFKMHLFMLVLITFPALWLSTPVETGVAIHHLVNLYFNINYLLCKNKILNIVKLFMYRTLNGGL